MFFSMAFLWTSASAIEAG